MSTIELVDPELRDALALLSSVPKPDLPDIATGEIHVESAFGAKPIRRSTATCTARAQTTCCA